MVTTTTTIEQVKDALRQALLNNINESEPIVIVEYTNGKVQLEPVNRTGTQDLDSAFEVTG